MLPTSTLFFVHIPKTAGTSFRRSIADAVGDGHCHFDYGPSSSETSPLVKQLAYDEPDLFRLQQALARASCRLLAGHVHAGRYAPLVPAARVVSFVRDPVQQVMSHYEHQRLHNRYPGSLEDFLRGPLGPGFQARVLAALPIEALGFVGVTERYEDSLRAFSTAFGITLEVRRLNLNPSRAQGAFPAPAYAVPDELRGLMEERGGPDQVLYQRANALLDARLEAMAAAQPFVHGALTAVVPTHIGGFAYLTGSQKPVRVQVLVNRRIVREVLATADRPALRALKVPRNAFVGFDYRPAEPLAVGDSVSVRVAATGQLLGEIDLFAPKERRGQRS
ncbi:MAG: sulfotransferase family 2 domain-containing protein [Burkholderiales bacterium]|nr:sulfotransferase family 2 domain-containing protein [Burkholderiales bacterium]